MVNYLNDTGKDVIQPKLKNIIKKQLIEWSLLSTSKLIKL